MQQPMKCWYEGSLVKQTQLNIVGVRGKKKGWWRLFLYVKLRIVIVSFKDSNDKLMVANYMYMYREFNLIYRILCENSVNIKGNMSLLFKIYFPLIKDFCAQYRYYFYEPRVKGVKTLMSQTTS